MKIYTKHCNDNGNRIVNFNMSKNLRVKSTLFPHRNIHKYTWTSPDGKTHNQIDHILLDRRRHSNVLDVQSFRTADCDTDHCLVVAKIRERLEVNKQISSRFHMERFILKKVNKAEGKDEFRVEVSNRFAALEYFDADVEINSDWEMIRWNITFSISQILTIYSLLATSSLRVYIILASSRHVSAAQSHPQVNMIQYINTSESLRRLLRIKH
jgi:hypothetical protein